MRISREEVFGPVANILWAKNYEEALALANDTEFGLSAGIATTSLKHATHFKRHSQAGMVMVNLPTAGVDWTGSVRCARRRSLSWRRNTARSSPRCSTSAICWI